MATHKWRDLEARRFTPEQIKASRKRVEEEVLELSLRALREEAGLTQAQLADAAEMAQGEVSKVERRDDHLVSTLRQVVKALGGELEIYARLGGRKIKLVGV